MTLRAVKEGVHDAFDAITDEESPMSMEERFDALGQQMIAHAFAIMDRQRRTKQRITTDEKEFQEDGMAQLRMIEKVYYMLKKNGRLPQAQPNENFDTQLMTAIRAAKSSMADIVQKLPTHPNDSKGDGAGTTQ